MLFSQYLLLKLMEECSEVAQCASKQIQFGKDEVQANALNSEVTPEMKLSNAQRLRAELNDLLAVISMLESEGEIPLINQEELLKSTIAKIEKIAKYYKKSVAFGRVLPPNFGIL